MLSSCYDPILFECLTGDVIKWASWHTHGAAGPSGIDAYCWKRMYKKGERVQLPAYLA